MKDELNTLKTEETIPMRLRRAYLTMHRAAQAHFTLLGVTADQYVLLTVLADEDGVTQSEIGERMSSDANTIGAMLRLLEGKKLIRREKCDDDGRARRVYLTAAGRRLQKELIESSRELHERIESSISAAERKLMFSILDRLTSTISRADEARQKVG